MGGGGAGGAAAGRGGVARSGQGSAIVQVGGGVVSLLRRASEVVRAAPIASLALLAGCSCECTVIGNDWGYFGTPYAELPWPTNPGLLAGSRWGADGPLDGRCLQADAPEVPLAGELFVTTEQWGVRMVAVDELSPDTETTFEVLDETFVVVTGGGRDETPPPAPVAEVDENFLLFDPPDDVGWLEWRSTRDGTAVDGIVGREPRFGMILQVWDDVRVEHGCCAQNRRILRAPQVVIARYVDTAGQAGPWSDPIEVIP